MRLGHLFSVCAMATIVACSSLSDSLAEAKARDLLLGAFPESYVQRFYTGSVQFWNKNEINIGTPVSLPEDELRFYRELANSGYIEISDERDLTAQFSGWDNWFKLSQSGVRHTAVISTTNKATQDKRFRIFTEHRVANFQVAEQRIEVVAIQPYASQTEKYSVVSVILKRQSIGDDLSRLYEQSVGRIVDQKLRVLCQYDLFKKEWVLGTFDIADFDADFRTRNVESQLELMKATATE